MQKKNDYSNLILNALLDKGVIDESLYEKCSKPSYISELPGDLRTTDLNVLNDRKKAIEKELKDIDKNIEKYEKQINEQYKEFQSLSRDIKKDKNNMIDRNFDIDRIHFTEDRDFNRELSQRKEKFDKSLVELDRYLDGNTDNFVNDMENLLSNENLGQILWLHGQLQNGTWALPKNLESKVRNMEKDFFRITHKTTRYSIYEDLNKQSTSELEKYQKMKSDFETELELTNNKINTI